MLSPVRETTSENDRAVGMTISVGHGTQDMIFVQHTQVMEEAAPGGPCQAALETERNTSTLHLFSQTGKLSDA